MLSEPILTMQQVIVINIGGRTGKSVPTKGPGIADKWEEPI